MRERAIRKARMNATQIFRLSREAVTPQAMANAAVVWPEGKE